jgi:uncharacterized protein DUF6572
LVKSMTVEQSDVVDIISLDEAGSVVLTISDHVDWSNSAAHQHILQTKLNRYLAFVESGEILESYSDARGRVVVLKVVFKFKPDEAGQQFLLKAKQIVESAGMQFCHEMFAASYDN